MVQFTIGTQNLLHYNDDYETRLDNYKNNIQGFVPDIQCFQEAASWMNGKSLYKNFLKWTGYSYHFRKTNSALVMKEGLANTSKYELKEYRYLRLPHDRMFHKRTALLSTVVVEGVEIVVMNVHLSPHAENKYRRVDQIEYIKKMIEKDYYGKNIIILGDFNQDFEEDFFQPLYEIGFKNVLSAKTCTYCNGDNPYAGGPYRSKLDYIFYRPSNLELNDSGLYNDKMPVSDHYGVWAKFSVER